MQSNGSERKCISPHIGGFKAHPTDNAISRDAVKSSECTKIKQSCRRFSDKLIFIAFVGGCSFYWPR